MTTDTEKKLAGAVLNILWGRYTLSSGEVVEGNALSFIEAQLRSEGWRRLPPYTDFVALLEKLGFSVSRGRGERFYGGGKTGLGVVCDVVHI